MNHKAKHFEDTRNWNHTKVLSSVLITSSVMAGVLAFQNNNANADTIANSNTEVTSTIHNSQDNTDTVKLKADSSKSEDSRQKENVVNEKKQDSQNAENTNDQSNVSQDKSNLDIDSKENTNKDTVTKNEEDGNSNSITNDVNTPQNNSATTSTQEEQKQDEAVSDSDTENVDNSKKATSAEKKTDVEENSKDDKVVNASNNEGHTHTWEDVMNKAKSAVKRANDTNYVNTDYTVHGMNERIQGYIDRYQKDPAGMSEDMDIERVYMFVDILNEDIDNAEWQKNHHYDTSELQSVYEEAGYVNAWVAKNGLLNDDFFDKEFDNVYYYNGFWDSFSEAGYRMHDNTPDASQSVIDSLVPKLKDQTNLVRNYLIKHNYSKPTELNLEDLKEATDKAYQYFSKIDGYSLESLDHLMEALDKGAGKKWIGYYYTEIFEASQKDIDTETKNILDAINALVVKSNSEEMKQLQSSYDRVAQYSRQSSNYTVDSFAKFSLALNNVQALLNNPNATKGEVDKALTSLNVAFNGLEKVPNNDTNSNDNDDSTDNNNSNSNAGDDNPADNQNNSSNTNDDNPANNQNDSSNDNANSHDTDNANNANENGTTKDTDNGSNSTEGNDSIDNSDNENSNSNGNTAVNDGKGTIANDNSGSENGKLVNTNVSVNSAGSSIATENKNSSLTSDNTRNTFSSQKLPQTGERTQHVGFEVGLLGLALSILGLFGLRKKQD